MATDTSATLQSISNAKRALKDGEPTRDSFEGAKGSVTFSGTGAATVFNIPHGLGVVPGQAFTSPTTAVASALRTVTKDATNLIVTYAVAPANAIDNIKLDWIALYA